MPYIDALLWMLNSTAIVASRSQGCQSGASLMSRSFECYIARRFK